MGSIRCLVFVALTLLSLSGRLCLGQETTAKGVRNALQDLNEWLGDGSNGERWRQFLQSDRLHEQLEKDAADRRVVGSILGTYQCELPGLDHPRFGAVRGALASWANELGVPMTLRWAGRAGASKAAYRPIGESDVRRTKSELDSAINDLDRYLASAGHEPEQAWKSFLKWDTLQSYLRGDEKLDNSLDEVLFQFYHGHPGLELPKFVAVRQVLQRYVDQKKILQADPDAQRRLMAGRLDRLADALVEFNQQASAKAASEIASQLNWLDSMGQAPGLLLEMRRYFQRPNVLMHVSEGFVSRGVSDRVDEFTPVDEMILGTHVRGTGHTTGIVSADLVPSSDGARMEIVLTGTTDTKSIGTQGPVRIYSRSNTTVDARRSLLIDPKQVFGDPARASCRTHTRILDIVPTGHLGRRLVERIAWKRAFEQLPQAQQIASRRAEGRVSRRMDGRSRDLLARANRRLRNELRAPLDRRGLLPDSLNLSSTNHHLSLTAVQANASQFATFSGPPPFPGPHDVVLQVHESMINNTAEQALAGLTLTDQRVAELAEEVTGSVPEELQLSEDQAPWSITFDLEQPVTVEFDEEGFTLAVRGRRFTAGDRTLEEVMEMSAKYDMRTTPTGVRLLRAGDIEVTFPRRASQQLSAGDLFFKTLMRNKFAGLFKPEIIGEGIQMPGRWQKMGRIRLRKLSGTKGWLSLGWR